MFEKLASFLEGIPMTIVSGIFLLLSFLLPKLGLPFMEYLAWIPIIISGYPLVYAAIYKLLFLPGIRKISSALLITIAIIAAIGIGDLFAAGEVAFIMAIGEILEDVTTGRAKKGLKQLLRLAPTMGRRILDGKEEMIPAEAICQGDLLRILPGETIPVDGVVCQGETSIDQSIMTGESLPVDKFPGDEVYCGTINRFGSIDIKATRVGSDSSLQKLIRMVQEAENNKAPMARIVDKAASWMVPAALVIAIITGFVTMDLVRAVTVLVVFCPCALVLATPTAIMAAIGQATKHGVIVKSGEALERMGKVDTIAFDKTGTLTYGQLQVCDVFPADDSLLTLAASAESKSEHPLGQAIVSYAKKKGLSLIETTAFSMDAGKGVHAIIEGRNIYCGNASYLESKGIVLSLEFKEHLQLLQSQGKASVLVADDTSCLGIIALSDVLREDSAQIVARLQQMDTNVVLLTGDHPLTAAHFAKEAGIKDVCTGLLPQDKVSYIQSLQQTRHRVCMVGDGVNDAPALKTAEVGVAMGTMGSDIAIEAADIALMQDDISKLPYLKRLSIATRRTIKLSITLSMVINLMAVVLSVLGILTPTTGALVHNAGSCFVVLIAALLYDRKFN